MNTKINEILQEIESVIVGKNEIVEKILMAIWPRATSSWRTSPASAKQPPP